jgi:2-keto-4-pentenoate hydratase/2-oxohepta-3-ene-1,7-dioic acid hydratase in catechol pathway
VTKDEIPDPNNLRIRSILNGKVMQDSSTSDMLFSVAEIVSDLSRSMTLLPGTVIMTGTPEGVGFVRKPPVFLRHGDVITIDIEGWEADEPCRTEPRGRFIRQGRAREQGRTNHWQIGAPCDM